MMVAVPVACALLATACSSDTGKGDDDLQIVANPVAATAPVSPAPAASPAGTVLPAGHVTAMASDDHTLAVAVADPPSVLLYPLGDLNAAPARVAVDGTVEQLSFDAGQVLASIPGKGEVARITDGSHVGELGVPGQPVDAIGAGGETLVAVRDRKAVEVYQGGKLAKTISGGLYSADEVVRSGDQFVVLDRLRTAVFLVDVPGGTIGAGLRAGDGATNAVADSFGRVLVTDTRAGALLAFSTDPLLLRQMYPVPGGVYGIAYDSRRHLAWVTLTGTNQVVGFDVRGGEPVEKYRFPTVRQPDSVTVDAASGKVYVGSATGEGIQVVQP
ncbi:lipoprotein [Amycolatopsis acidiphila]|uniref:YncE family protein n=2 Tax=Amycolatopsis acidiphila TaxID=715473 RepID=UPI0019B19640|nr:lipoprotein [Amycolatopsis acidiphila]